MDEEGKDTERRGYIREAVDNNNYGAINCNGEAWLTPRSARNGTSL